MKDKLLKALEDRVLEILPDAKRRQAGPYALFECFESIPCNPCYTSCKFNAVKPLTNINDLPETYFDQCTGCGVCITVCPGLAAFVIDESYSDAESLVKIPYEYSPLPAKGAIVDGVNRIGEPVAKVRIERVTAFKNKTAVLTLAVPKDLTHVIRGIRTTPREALIGDADSTAQLGESIVCRCEDVTENELKALLADGTDSLKQVKLHTRLSMGPCQGKTCIALALRELAAKANIPIERLDAPKYRQPIKPIKIGSFLGEPKD